MMITLIAVFLLIVIFIFIDLVPLYQEQQWMSFWIYTIFLSVVLIFSLLSYLEVNIPSPAGPIKSLISAILGLK